MAQFDNPMQIFKLLNGSNCRKCNEKTCMAFAAAVFKGKRSLEDCPYVDPTIARRYEGRSGKLKSVDEEMAETAERLRKNIKGMDLEEAAARIGGRILNNRLHLKILGKDFSVDRQGRFAAEIHMMPWVTIPLLNYILCSEGQAPTGRWLPFRKLEDARERAGVFQRRCEAPVKRIADAYTDLFADMLELFDGKPSAAVDADIGVILHPLPKVPILFCYWRPEEGLDSGAHIFFNDTADANLGSDPAYTLCLGLVSMFEKIALKHGA